MKVEKRERIDFENASLVLVCWWRVWWREGPKYGGGRKLCVVAGKDASSTIVIAMKLYHLFSGDSFYLTASFYQVSGTKSGKAFVTSFSDNKMSSSFPEIIEL